MKDNSKHYRGTYGVDIALELQNALIAVTKSSWSVKKHKGYLVLGCDDPDKDSRLINLENKFDFLANGKAKTGYHSYKESYLEQDMNVTTVNCLVAIDEFIRSNDAKEFLESIGLLN